MVICISMQLVSGPARTRNMLQAGPLLTLLPPCCVRLQLLLLENVRFYKEEEKNDAEFAKKVRQPAPTRHPTVAAAAFVRQSILGRLNMHPSRCSTCTVAKAARCLP